MDIYVILGIAQAGSGNKYKEGERHAFLAYTKAANHDDAETKTIKGLSETSWKDVWIDRIGTIPSELHQNDPGVQRALAEGFFANIYREREPHFDRSFLKDLPKIETSFQDSFCGCKDEIFKTPKYILDRLKGQHIQPSIGQKILLWEKDGYADDQEYYLCNVGEIVELAENKIATFESDSYKISRETLIELNNKPVFIKIDPEGYFDLPLDSEVFIESLKL